MPPEQSRVCRYSSLEKIVIDQLELFGINYRTQVPVRSGFILDFLVPPNKVIEVDGPHHKFPERKKHDWARDRILQSSGYRVFRIPMEIVTNPDELNNILKIILGE